VGDRLHLRECDVDLTTHITDIANLLFYEDISDAVLVGHSYAGMVITGVAAVVPERLKLLVYLDAYIPDEGQSEFDLWTPEMRAEIEADGAAGRGLRPPPPPSLMGIDDPLLADWYQARVTPHPYATYTQPVPPGSSRSEALPRAYISCTAGPLTSIFGRFAEKARRSGWEVRTIATGHEAELIAPLEVADLLIDLAGSRG
jgi:pimeloyl-ACP methyl ester carboxylesterase